MFKLKFLRVRFGNFKCLQVVVELNFLVKCLLFGVVALEELRF